MAIIGNIKEVARQAAGTESLHKGLSFLTDLMSDKIPDLSTRAKQLKAGENFEVPIAEKNVYAIFQAYNSRQRSEGFFEAHKEFTDIQLLLSGEEWIETCPLSEHGAPPVYDDKNNFFFPLGEKAGTRFFMRAGMAAVLFPADAHAPGLRSGEEAVLVRKVVVKVKNAALPAGTREE